MNVESFSFAALTARAGESPLQGTRRILFPFPMPPFSEELFIDSISLLSKQLQLCVREAQDEFRRDVREILAKHDRQAQDEYAKSGGRVQLTIDVFHVRHSQYGRMLKLVGDGFLNAFNEVVKPYTGVFSPQMRFLISQELTKPFTLMIKGEKGAIQRNAAAMGRIDIADSAIRSMEQTFLSANSMYHQLLDIEIGKHDLSVRSGKMESAAENVEAKIPELERPKKRSGAKRKSKSEMKRIYNSVVTFHSRKRREYENQHGTPYGAAKFADEETAKEIWRVHRIKVSPRNVRDAMSRGN